jgi:hypothetical protein
MAGGGGWRVRGHTRCSRRRRRARRAPSPPLPRAVPTRSLPCAPPAPTALIKPYPRRAPPTVAGLDEAKVSLVHVSGELDLCGPLSLVKALPGCLGREASAEWRRIVAEGDVAGMLQKIKELTDGDKEGEVYKASGLAVRALRRGAPRPHRDCDCLAAP